MKYSKVLFTVVLSIANLNLSFFPDTLLANDPARQEIQGKRTINPSESDVVGTPKNLSRSLNMSNAKPVIQTMSVGAGSAMVNGLSGTYTIPGDFPSIEAFAAVLNYVGVSGNTVIELTSVSYIEDPIVLGPHPGQDDYTVTIRPAAGKNVIIKFKTTVDGGKGLVFTGARNIIVDGIGDMTTNLTLQIAEGYPFPVNDAFGATIYLTGASKNIAIKNAIVKGLVDNEVWASVADGRPAIFMWAADEDGEGMKDLTFDNLTITNATYAFKALQYQFLLDYVVRGLTIQNCKIGSAYGAPVAEGGLYETVIDLNFSNNIIDGVDFPRYFWISGYTEWDYDGGIFYPAGTAPFMHGFGQISGSHFLVQYAGIYKNNIFRNIGSGTVLAGDGVQIYGVRIYNYGLAGTQLTNNRIYNISGAGGTGSKIVGIRGQAEYVYHNSVRLTGSTAAGTSTTCIQEAKGVYNNAFSNEMTGATDIFGVTASGTYNYNAIYSTGRYVSAYATPNAALLAGFNVNGSFGPIGFDTDLHINTGPSTAEAIGSPIYAGYAGDDIDAEGRSGVNPDAGADEFPALAITWGPDVFPAGVSVGSSIPTGITQNLSVSIKNNSATAVTNLNINLTIIPDGYNQNSVIPSIPAGGTATALFPAWTPVSPGNRTLTARTMLAGDVQPMNDTIFITTDVQTPMPIIESYTWTWDTGDEGWTRTVDWVRSNSFTKLGGPFGGGYSMVTERPDRISTYTEGAYATMQGYNTSYPGPNLLISPWLDLSGLGRSDALYISFFMSIKVEPDWDRCWMEYTVDGIHWKHLGKLNDPQGVNWYREDLYEHALSGGNIDDATLFYYGLIHDYNELPITGWTSNGENYATGPFGYIFVQLQVMKEEYPDLVGAQVVKFRYVAFSDAATAEDPGGWAIDDFHIGLSGASDLFDYVTGRVFHDINGNGIDDAEPPEANINIDVVFDGLPATTIRTNSNGVFSFMTYYGLSGNYEFTVKKPGYAFTLPFGNPTAVVNCPGIFSSIIQDFGTYQGSISGVKFSDFDDDSSDIETGDPLLAGWILGVHMDSATGKLVGIDTTDGSGAYAIPVPPYPNYFVTEVPKPNNGRRTFPPGGSHVLNVNGNSGSQTANISGINFGNFIFGKWTNEISIDRNGNGVRESGDFTALPAGSSLNFEVFKNNVPFDTITMGSGNPLKIWTQLDVGNYGIKRTSPVPEGWIQTSIPDSIGFDISMSGYNDTSNFLYFKLLTVSGKAFDDIGGNGVRDTGETGLENRTINLNGDGGGSQVTDLNGGYLFTGVGPGVHEVTVTPPSGWIATSGPFNFIAQSGDVFSNNKIFDFGNFKTVCINGTKFNDRNNNGVKDAGEEGLPGWNINMTGQTTVVTNFNGEYHFCDVGPGAYAITEDAQTGWLLTLPVGGQYDIVTASGAGINNLDFGNFRESDTAMFRTFTYQQLAADLKKNKTPKAGKPITAPPNMANLLEQLMLEGAAPLVGLENIADPVSGKIKAYLKPAKYEDIIKTFNKKGVLHTGTPRGYDRDNKGKQILKRWKSMEPTRANNLLTAQLLTLQVNLWASQLEHTPVGLGALIYTWPGILSGLTIDEIAAYGDDIMTNWAYIPKENYDSLYEAVKRINETFSNTVVNDTVQGWFPRLLTKPYSKSTWASYKTAYEVPFLRVNPAIKPFIRPMVQPEQLPMAYRMGQNYPNPFNPTTTLEFNLPIDAIVTLKVYNVLGQEVATLLDHEIYYAGSEEVDFDASTFSSGIYLYRIVAESLDDDNRTTGEIFTQIKKMVLMK